MNVFDSISYLEPRCEECGTKIDWGETTRFDEDKEGHICITCGTLI